MLVGNIYTSTGRARPAALMSLNSIIKKTWAHFLLCLLPTTQQVFHAPFRVRVAMTDKDAQT